MSYRTLFAAVLAFAIATPMVRAQQQGGSNSGGASSGNTSGDSNNSNRGDRGNRGSRFDPSRLTDMLKERLAPTDDEWKVIQPKLEKVTEARRDTMGSMFGAFRRRSSDSSSSSDANRSPMQQASQGLRDILDKKDATAEEINAKLTAYREARDKARQTLAAAQKDLKDVLTQRQEAVLVSMGMLD